MALKYLRILFIWTALYGVSIGLAAETASPQVRLVTKLYEDFAFEVVINSPARTRPYFIRSPRATLNRYLMPDLTASLLRNLRMGDKTNEESSLDFGPLWGSQDPMGSWVTISDAKKSDVVEVEITQHGGPDNEPNRYSIFYTLKRSKAGWRIDDILYMDLGDGEQHTLRNILRTD